MVASDCVNADPCDQRQSKTVSLTFGGGGGGGGGGVGGFLWSSMKGYVTFKSCFLVSYGPCTYLLYINGLVKSETFAYNNWKFVHV